jgi:hypothetical protein
MRMRPPRIPVEEAIMEHRLAAEIERAGGSAMPLPTSRNERLQRWAEALERLGSERLATLWRTEFAMGAARAGMRAENSPLSVAFADPVLRVAGLRDDSYAEAKRFFGLSDWQLHWAVCYCRHGETMSAEGAARQVRAMIKPPSRGVVGWLGRVLVGRTPSII